MRKIHSDMLKMLRLTQVPLIAPQEVFGDYVDEQLESLLAEFTGTLSAAQHQQFTAIKSTSNKVHCVSSMWLESEELELQQRAVRLESLNLLRLMHQVMIRKGARNDFIFPGDSNWERIEADMYGQLSALALRESATTLQPYYELPADEPYEVGRIDYHVLTRVARPAAMLVEYIVN